ncbi:MAG: hypothetical protein ACYDBB_26980 [Armatimonadota bacterium]
MQFDAPAVPYALYWWQEGFSSVYRTSQLTRNPLGTAHLVTSRYRCDLSRYLGGITGLSVGHGSGERLLFGNTLPPAEIGLTTALAVEYAGQAYTVSTEVDTARVLQVNDAGPVCHDLRWKGITVMDTSGIPSDAMEIETALCAWQDCLALTVSLITCSQRLSVTGGTRLRLTLTPDGAAVTLRETAAILTRDGRPAFAIIPVMGTTLEMSAGALIAQATGPQLCLHLLPLADIDTLDAHRALLAGDVRVGARDADGQALPVSFDPLRAAHVVGGLTTMGTEETRVILHAETDAAFAVPVRVLLAREARPRIQPDGSLLPPEEVGSFSPLCAYPVGVSATGQPTGACWQVSTDIHDFADFPQPYTRCWLHLYHQGIVRREAPMDEQVRLGWAKLGQRPAAQFLQLSLLGWDDHPRYGGGTADGVQLWHQGIINHQEITCINPEPYLCGNAITDIRPIDYTHSWGPNQGGGDFLRYQVAGETTYRRLHAARAHFENYGPYLGTVRYFLTSEEEAIHGEFTAHIQAATDIARVYCETRYRVNAPLEVSALVLAWLGAPTYDFTASEHWAYGLGLQVLGEGETPAEVEGDQQTLLPDAVTPGMWFANYGSGVIDEQGRDPNANRGLVFRGGEAHLAAHPTLPWSALRVFSKRFKGPSSQFHLGLFPADGMLHLEPGDTFTACWEYVPVLKWASDVGDAVAVEHYRALLTQYPDQYQPVIHEAIHGAWAIEDTTGVSPINAVVPTIRLTGQQAEFTLVGGAGWLPLRVLLDAQPRALILEERSQEGWRAAKTPLFGVPPYQLERHSDTWTATLLIPGAPPNIEAPPLRRTFRIRMEG